MKKKITLRWLIQWVIAIVIENVNCLLIRSLFMTGKLLELRNKLAVKDDKNIRDHP